jgi:hypothetical protein
MYKPHFKQIERLQDVPLHFEIPTEYEPPKPMFSDPPRTADEDEETVIMTATSQPSGLGSNGSSGRPGIARAAAQTRAKRPNAEAAPPRVTPNAPPQDIKSDEMHMNNGESVPEDENTDSIPSDPDPAARNRGLRHVKDDGKVKANPPPVAGAAGRIKDDSSDQSPSGD